MSPLIPTNLSDGHKERRRQGRPSTWSPLDHPEFVWEGMSRNRPATIEELQSNCDQKISNESYRKARAVPVVMVNPDPLQTMEPDKYGAELGKEARVWKVYVKETDRWDAELVGGWNKSLDVILVFAALFSAVSTAFLIESSRKLQQDPSDISATALIRISQALVAMVNSSSADIPLVPWNSQPASGFISRKAIAVNTLWYLSLSLSIATSLLAMLAKDWCHSFAANRTGHPWDQALQRQQKWVIAVLPFLIHLSLLVFAVGLCIYVWDMNSTVAIPLICICGLAVGFYLWSSVMASFVKLFPYTTIISRAFQSDAVHLKYTLTKGRGKRIVSRVTPWISRALKYISAALYLIPTFITAVVCFPLLVLDSIRSLVSRSRNGYTSIEDGYFSESLGTADRFLHEMGDIIYHWFFYILMGAGMYAKTLRSHQQHESDSDQDQMTSLALKWLIQTCNTPGSVSIALQAIAGASPRIPKEPLETCQATLHILRQLVSSNPDKRTEAENKLYSRALTVLGSQVTLNQSSSENDTIGDIEVAIWDLKAEVERQVVGLINNTDFSPTEDNLQALKIGNTATSLSLQLLKGADQAASETFRSVITLLSNHIESGYTRFYQAALLSLSNAAILLTSCSAVSLLFPTLLHQCMDHCIQLLRFGGEIPQSKEMLDPRAVFLIYIPLHGYHQSTTTTNESHISMGARIQRATHVLMNRGFRKDLPQSAFYRVALCEVLFNSQQYGLDGSRFDLLDCLLSTERLCETYLDSGILLSRTTVLTLGRSAELYGGKNTESFKFLTAINMLYGPVEAQSSIALGSLAHSLPVPIYCTVVYITCLTKSDDERALCKRLLSRFAFPRMNSFLMPAMNQIMSKLWQTYHQTDPEPTFLGQLWSSPVAQLWPSTGSRNMPAAARSRHFAATQLWLLLHLVSNSSTRQQQDLKRIIEAQTGLGVQYKGVDRVKLELAEVIIEGYTEGHHLGVYSARVIECILQAHDLRNYAYDVLSHRIKYHLRGVPSHL